MNSPVPTPPPTDNLYYFTHYQFTTHCHVTRGMDLNYFVVDANNSGLQLNSCCVIVVRDSMKKKEETTATEFLEYNKNMNAWMYECMYNNTIRYWEWLGGYFALERYIWFGSG